MWVYLCCVSLASLVVCCYDKFAAPRGWRRVPEKWLFILSAMGGALMMFLTMVIVRHKTKHFSFMFFVPLMAIIHIALIMWFGRDYNFWL